MNSLRLVAAAALLCLGGTVVAAQPEQSGGYAAPGPSQQDTQPRVTDEQLEQFSTAMADVRSVQQDYSEQIQQTDDKQEAQALRQDAQSEMRGAVEDAGLTVSEYNMIAQQLQSNPNLSRRLKELESP